MHNTFPENRKKKELSGYDGIKSIILEACSAIISCP
jgi:hypothetical protein